MIIGTYPILDELYSSSVDDVSNGNSTRTDAYLANAPTLEICRYPSNLSLNGSDLPPYPDTGINWKLLSLEVL